MTSKTKISSNKSFGIVFFVVFLLIGIYPLIYNGEIRFWSIVISIIFLFLGLINSSILSPLNILWAKFGILLGKFISPIVMAIVFFLIVTPTGIIMRFLKKDLLKLKKSNKNTYWVDRSKIKSSMKDQF